MRRWLATWLLKGLLVPLPQQPLDQNLLIPANSGDFMLNVRDATVLTVKKDGTILVHGLETTSEEQIGAAFREFAASIHEGAKQ